MFGKTLRNLRKRWGVAEWKIGALDLHSTNHYLRAVALAEHLDVERLPRLAPDGVAGGETIGVGT
jgi:hypothetical protein